MLVTTFVIGTTDIQLNLAEFAADSIEEAVQVPYNGIVLYMRSFAQKAFGPHDWFRTGSTEQHYIMILSTLMSMLSSAIEYT